MPEPIAIGGSKMSSSACAASRTATLKAAGAVTTAGTNTVPTGGTDVVCEGFRSAEIQCKLTAAATEAGDTLDVYVDTTYDGGTTWVNLVHFPQMLGNGGAKTYTAHVGTTNPASAPVDVSADAAVNTVRNLGLGSQLRVRYTTVDVVTTSNMSFNFSVVALLKS